MIVKIMVGDLEDIRMEIRRRIHTHEYGIRISNIPCQEHGLSIKGHTHDDGGIVLVNMVGTACIVEKELVTAVGLIAIFYGIQDIKPDSRDLEALPGMGLIVLCIGVDPADSLNKATGVPLDVKVVHDVAQLKFRIILLQESGEAAAVVCG